MDNTIVQQGRFTSDGTTKTIKLRSDIDWFEVYNITNAETTQTTAVGVKHKWMRGFPDAAKWTTFKSDATNALDLEQYITSGGFTLVDSSTLENGPLLSTITAVSTAAIPVVTNTGVNGLVAGDVVRLHDVTGALQLGGIDFTVGLSTLTNTTFSLDHMEQLTVAGTTAKWRKINSNPAFYPAKRTIADISTGADSMIVKVTVDHDFSVGQKVRVNVPSSYGMTIDGLVGTIIAASSATLTVNIPSSSFGTFTWPASATGPFLRAEVTPYGTDTAKALSLGYDPLSGASEDHGYIGMNLSGGADSPGGESTDEIYWFAGKSFSVTNE